LNDITILFPRAEVFTKTSGDNLFSKWSDPNAEHVPELGKRRCGDDKFSAPEQIGMLVSQTRERLRSVILARQ
jgi:hypothetical protein